MTIEIAELKTHHGFAYVTTTNNEKMIIDCSSIDNSADGTFFIGLRTGDFDTWSVNIDCIASVENLLGNDYD